MANLCCDSYYCFRETNKQRELYGTIFIRKQYIAIIYQTYIECISVQAWELLELSVSEVLVNLWYKIKRHSTLNLYTFSYIRKA